MIPELLADVRRLAKWCVAAAAIGAAVMTATLAATVTYTYDELGRLKRVTYEDGTYTDYALDTAGNRTTVATATPPPGTVQLSASSYSIAENGISVTVTATRTSGSFGAVGVSYATSNGTATSGSDYTAASGTLSWANGDTSSKTFAVPIIDDAIYESNETFAVSLSAPTGGATVGTPSSATVTIVEDDSGAPSVPGNCRKSPTTGNGANYSILWNASSGPVTHYVLEEAANGGPFSPNYTINAPSVSKAFSNKPAGEYYYRVKACNSATGQCSGYSNVVFKLVCNPSCL